MTNIWKIVAGVALVLSIVGVAIAWSSSLPLHATFGSLGVKLAENYDPYLKYNGGFNTALPIQTTSTFAAGATTITGNITASGNMTASSSILTAAVSCIQLHATSTATTIKEVFVTTGATSTYSGTVYWAYGVCS